MCLVVYIGLTSCSSLLQLLILSEDVGSVLNKRKLIAKGYIHVDFLTYRLKARHPQGV